MWAVHRVLGSVLHCYCSGDCVCVCPCVLRRHFPFYCFLFLPCCFNNDSYISLSLSFLSSFVLSLFSIEIDSLSCSPTPSSSLSVRRPLLSLHPLLAISLPSHSYDVLSFLPSLCHSSLSLPPALTLLPFPSLSPAISLSPSPRQVHSYEAVVLL